VSLTRSGFKRPQLQRPPRAPLVPVERRGVYRPVSQEAVAVPKEIILRSRPYRMWVASHPCDLCGWPETQCAHENLGKALQGKVCDSRTFPLCVAHGGHMGHHYMFDNYVDISRDEARELGAKLSARTRERATAAGWRFTQEGIVAP
jgi:hypothetical protein